MADQSKAVGHSPRIGMASTAVIAGHSAGNAAAPEAPRMPTARLLSTMGFADAQPILRLPSLQLRPGKPAFRRRGSTIVGRGLQQRARLLRLAFLPEIFGEIEIRGAQAVARVPARRLRGGAHLLR